MMLEAAANARSFTNDALLLGAKEIDQLFGQNMAVIKQGVIDSLLALSNPEINQPMKYYLQPQGDGNPFKRISIMPVSIPGKITAIKTIGSNPENVAKGINRANGTITLFDVNTNSPVAILDCSLISSMRTFATSLICIDQLYPEPKSIAILGMGRLGRIHATLLTQLYPSIKEIRCFSHSNYDDFNPKGVNLVRCATYQDAINGADVIIAVSIEEEPYINIENLPSTVKLIINLSLMDFDFDIFKHASRIIVDSWEQCQNPKKIFGQYIAKERSKPRSISTITEILAAEPREISGYVICNPIGMAIQDAFVAHSMFLASKNTGIAYPKLQLDNRVNPLSEKLPKAPEPQTLREFSIFNQRKVRRSSSLPELTNLSKQPKGGPSCGAG